MIPNDQSPTRPARSPAQQCLRFISRLLVLAPFLVILAILTSRNSGMHTHPAKTYAAQYELSSLAAALDDFQIDTHRYPTTTEGLDILCHNTGIPGWKGPYARTIPTDPWANPYRYESPAASAPYTLTSDGPDGLPGTRDDIHP